ncbi:dTDP-4-dehydrorhamnose reductase [Alistipes sp. OttesenSCG-928-B03]|nr:dTDP-4-dehydrorhamnose reductase [Alistipes sp. OttesenSCG-928-B03]
MVILVTGADGQLGRSLRKISAEYPAHRFVFTDLSDGDIASPERMRELADGTDLIVNCAAYTAVDKAESDILGAMRVNRDGPAVLAAVARERGIPVIHISTDYVFSGESDRPWRPDDRTEPVNVYGRTKLLGEKELRLSGCDAVVIRTSWLYSEFGHNFVRTMLRLGGEGRPLRVVNDQIGAPTYATGLARAVMAVAEHGVRGFELYHYTDAGQTTWHGLAQEIFRQAGMNIMVEPVTTTDYPTAARRPRYSVLDTSRLAVLGVEMRDWRESLAECLNTMKAGWDCSLL